MREVGRVRALLERYAGEASEPPVSDADELPGDGAVDLLCARMGLTTFERQIVIMCAAPDLDGRFAAVLACAHGDATRTYPTFGLALAALNEPHWSALTTWPSRAIMAEPVLSPGG